MWPGWSGSILVAKDTDTFGVGRIRVNTAQFSDEITMSITVFSFSPPKIKIMVSMVAETVKICFLTGP